MKFKTTYNQYIPNSTTKTLRTGAGEVHAIIVTCLLPQRSWSSLRQHSCQRKYLAFPFCRR